jgi:hypothetical protein
LNLSESLLGNKNRSQVAKKTIHSVFTKNPLPPVISSNNVIDNKSILSLKNMISEGHESSSMLDTFHTKF